jgi:single-strand DNA-binding protein
MLMIVGNLGKDPEIKQTKGGEDYARFSVCVSEKYGDTKTAHWFDCVAFRKTAELVGKYLKKGSKVFLEGNPELKQWESKDGKAFAAISVVVNKITFLDPVNKKESEPVGNNNNEKDQPNFNEDEELPF